MGNQGDIVTVTVQQLTDASSGEAVMSYECYKSLSRRQKLTVIRQGKGLDHCALIEYDSLPTRYKDRFIAIYGDPYEKKRQQEMEIPTDQEARTFFEDYVLPDGTHLKSDKIDEFTTNASVLNALIDMETTQGVQRRMHGNHTPINWEAIYKASADLRDRYGHTMPKSNARLRDKIREYKRDGYAALVSGHIANNNSCKITPEGGMFILALKCSKKPVYSNAQILAKFNEVAPSKGWKPLKSLASITGFLSRPEVEIMWKGAVLGDTKAMMQYTRAHSTILPTLPNALWYYDGTKMNLYYKAYRDGKYVPATLVVSEVMDAASEVLLGCHISDRENFESIYGATRKALEFARCRPYEYVTDNQGGTKRADAQEWLRKVAVCYRPTAPHRAPAKTIESAFGRFQAQVLHQHWFYTGGNITAKGEAARVNMEFILANIDKLPTYDEVVDIYMKAREQWNDMPHPNVKAFGGKTRMEVYTSQVNPKAVPLTDAVRRDLFWITTSKPSTFRADGIWFTVNGERLQYEVFDQDGNPDLMWRRSNTGREFYVSYDPDDLAVVRLMTKDQYGYRFECEAKPYFNIHRDLLSQTSQERSFIREQDERNKIDRIQRQLELDNILRAHGMAPDQQGLVDPGLTALNEGKKSYERLLERAEAGRRTEPEPAEVYPATIGQLEKAESLLTPYDETAALSRI